MGYGAESMTNEFDLVQRLRGAANGIVSLKTDRGDFGLCDDAAEEIERLRIMVATRDQMFAKLQRKLKEQS